MKYRYLWEPGTTSYRGKRAKLTPEEQEIVRRRVQLARDEHRRKFPELYRNTD